MSKVNMIVRKIGFEKAAAAGAAALAAVSVVLIPADILSNAVTKAGLDTMFAPLSPPIGTKARIGLALLVAGVVFGIVLSAMSLLDALTRKRPTKPPRDEVEAAEDTPAPPRVRRRDKHPDAPTRAPFSPVRELGDPDVVTAEADAPLGRLRRFRATPAIEAEATPVPQVAAPWPERAPAEVTPEPVPTDANPFLERLPVNDEVPVALEPEQVARPEPASIDAGPEAEPEHGAVEPAPPFAERRTGERRREEPTGRETIAELMVRLERALGTESAEAAPVPVIAAELPVQDLAPAPPAAVPAEPREEAPVGDDRLRSAIEQLKRVASRA